MKQNQFDDLTRSLASSTSRRQALKLLGGGLLAALLPHSALAKGGNSACAKFCAQVFGADTPAAKQCTSDAAMGTGLCYQCGPAAPANHPPLCGQTCCTTSVANATATCTNGTCGFTCNTGFQLCNGQCVATCTSPKVLNPTTCTCECPATPCNGGVLNSTTCVCECPSGTLACSTGCCNGFRASCECSNGSGIEEGHCPGICPATWTSDCNAFCQSDGASVVTNTCTPAFIC